MASGLSNPYTFGVPVKKASGFFGREQELGLVFETLNRVPRGSKQDIAVLGPRRIGKSSLLYRLVDLLQDDKQDFVPVYIDVQHIKPQKDKLLFYSILKEIRNGYHKRFPDKELPSFQTLSSSSIPEDLEFLTFGEDMETLDRLINTQNLPRVVLMFDEADVLLQFGGQSTLAWFRSLIQRVSYMIFIVAGSELLYSMTQDYGSPFFNIFKSIELKALTPEAARDLLLKPATGIGMEIYHEEANRIVHASGNNPYFIQAIGHYLVQVLNERDRKRVLAEDANLALNNCIKKLDGQFEYMWGLMSQVQKAILYTLARFDKPMLPENLISRSAYLCEQSQASEDFDPIFQDLIQQQISRRDKHTGKYWFQTPLFSDWIKANIEAEDLAPLREKGIEPAGQLEVAIQPRMLRAFLQRRLDDVELESLVLDYFPAVWNRLSRGMRKDEKTNILLDYVRRNDTALYDLAALLKRRYPNDYDVYFTGKSEISSIKRGGGITAELYKELVTSLLNCGPFASNSELRSIFVDSRLSPWRSRLPEASTAQSRVMVTIALLVDTYNVQGDNALVLLLEVLVDATSPSDVCHRNLATLADKLRSRLE